MISSLHCAMEKKVWLSAMPKGVNKLVLLVFCRHVNDVTGLSWPSVSRVAKMCSMSERTVQGHIRALLAAGLLRPRLRTGRTTSYTVHLESLIPLDLKDAVVVLDAADQAVDNSTECAGSMDNSALTPAVFAENLLESAPEPAENDIKDVEICTLTDELTFKNVERTEPPAPALPALMMIDGVNPQVLADFAAIRAKKRVGPLNATALEALCGEAAIAGMSLEQVLKTCCTRNWARFEASWLADTGPRATTPSPAAITVPAPPADPPPEPVKLAAPEVAAAGRERLAAIRQTPASTATGPGPGWAHIVVNKAKSGQRVGHAALSNACKVLKLDPASLTSNTAATAGAATAAARMH